MNKPLVDITIAVHTATRPIARAVSSVVDHNSADLRVNVVAHNISMEIIRENLGSYAEDPRVRLLHLQDGIPSPAGPMNFGLENSTADFVAVMGSDDELEPGAIDSWLALQRRSRAGVVMARIRHAGGGNVPSPPTRPFRRVNLDPVKDRLSYRSAPLGLISRAAFGDLRFSDGLSSGEDLAYVSTLWYAGERIAFDRKGPAYLVHSDAEDRVTSAPRPVSEDFAFLDRILDEPWFERLNPRQRTSLVIKLIRMHLFDAVVNRSQLPEFPRSERKALADVARRMMAWSDHPERMLSVLDHKLLDGILDEVTPVDDLMTLIRRRWNYRSADVVLTRNPLFTLHRQGPLRTYIGGYLVGG